MLQAGHGVPVGIYFAALSGLLFHHVEGRLRLVVLDLSVRSGLFDEPKNAIGVESVGGQMQRGVLQIVRLVHLDAVVTEYFDDSDIAALASKMEGSSTLIILCVDLSKVFQQKSDGFEPTDANCLMQGRLVEVHAMVQVCDNTVHMPLLIE